MEEIADTKTAPTPPSLSHRWLGAVPLFVSFMSLGGYLTQHERFKNAFEHLRIDLPLPTQWALFFGGIFSKYPVLFLPGMLVPLWLYFGWAAKKRERMMWFNLAAFVLCMLAICTFIAGPILPLCKIQEALRKR